MARYILGKILWTIPLMIGVVTILLVLIKIAPGDACTRREHAGMSNDAVCAMRCHYGCALPAECVCKP